MDKNKVKKPSPKAIEDFTKELLRLFYKYKSIEEKKVDSK